LGLSAARPVRPAAAWAGPARGRGPVAGAPVVGVSAEPGQAAAVGLVIPPGLALVLVVVPAPGVTVPMIIGVVPQRAAVPVPRGLCLVRAGRVVVSGLVAGVVLAGVAVVVRPAGVAGLPGVVLAGVALRVIAGLGGIVPAGVVVLVVVAPARV